MVALRLIAGPVALCIVAACGGYNAPTGTTNNNPPPKPTTNDINIVQGAQNLGTNAFSPPTKNLQLTGSADSTVRWVNMDISGGDYTMGTAVQHDITSDDGGATFHSGPLNGNATFSHKFLAPGDYPYHCSIHPTMKGTVHVTP
jgi:plastocyanin